GAGAWRFGYLFLPPSGPLSPIPTLAVLDCEPTNERPLPAIPAPSSPLASFLCAILRNV
ncbi:hypothetical protein K443DRAFT_681509, partial [Laccaria amethystina LaAM-08-1]